MSPAPLRPDLELICDWIRPGAHILDLACGDGTLLAHLAADRQVTGYGLEIDADEVASCIENGINVIQADIDDGLHSFDDDSFDYVVMTQALQALQRPDLVISEILRVGRVGIVTFPNFGHWRARWALARGRMPLTKALPAQWYETQNIHLCTVADFDALCAQSGWEVLSRRLLDGAHRQGAHMRLAPNLFSQFALYMLRAPGAA